MTWKVKCLAILTVSVCSLFCLLSTKTLAFDPFGSTCRNTAVQGGNGAQSPVCTSNNNAQSDSSQKNVVLKTINTASNIIAFLAGVVAVIIMIISGLTMVTAGGNSEQVTGARRRIIYAAVGLAIIALAWTIVRFITDKVL